VQEADTVIDRALADIVGREEAVDVVGAEIGDHFRRRHRTQLHVGVGIEAVLGEIIAQQIIVHRVVEGNGKLHALPILRIALVLVLDRKRDALPVDVLDRRNRERDRGCAETERDRDRHRRQHMGCVVFLIYGLVADHGPARGLDDLDVETMLGIEAERRRHDDRRRAGDGDEADLQILFLRRALLGKNLGRGLDREKLRDRGKRRRSPDRFQEGPARGILRKHRAHDCRCNDAFVALLLGWNRLASQRQRRVFVLRCGPMLAANAARPLKRAIGVKRIIEGRHAPFLCVLPR
jgi:hypothetical protein